MIKRVIKYLLSLTEYELVNKNKLTSNNLLGLKSLGINTIIDVGANRGQFLSKYLQHFPNAIFYCFEPLFSEFQLLQNRFSLLKSKIILVNCALGNQEGKIIFHHHKHSSSSSILNTTDKCSELYPQTKDQKDIEVNITKIDTYYKDILTEHNKNVLLKIDVQGFELEVLKGGIKTLSMISACLLEINFMNLYSNQTNFTEIHEMLNKNGFEYAGAMDQNFNDEGLLVFSDILFLRK